MKIKSSKTGYNILHNDVFVGTIIKLSDWDLVRGRTLRTPGFEVEMTLNGEKIIKQFPLYSETKSWVIAQDK